MKEEPLPLYSLKSCLLLAFWGLRFCIERESDPNRQCFVPDGLSGNGQNIVFLKNLII
jgi:hypothetical protein